MAVNKYLISLLIPFVIIFFFANQLEVHAPPNRRVWNKTVYFATRACAVCMLEYTYTRSQILGCPKMSTYKSTQTLTDMGE